jgi:uncharacterized integral membrane protein
MVEHFAVAEVVARSNRVGHPLNMVSEFFNKKISTPVGVVILLAIVLLVGWMIIRQYEKLMEVRIEHVEIRALGKEQ